MKRLFTLVEDQLGFPVFEKIEEAKRELSSKHEGRVRFEYPYINLDELIQKDQFESYIESPIEIILSALDETVKRSGLNYSEVDLVCCTGGTARVPRLRKAIEQRFGIQKMQEHRVFHSVVDGLAERAKEIFQVV